MKRREGKEKELKEVQKQMKKLETIMKISEEKAKKMK